MARPSPTPCEEGGPRDEEEKDERGVGGDDEAVRGGYALPEGLISGSAADAIAMGGEEVPSAGGGGLCEDAGFALHLGERKPSARGIDFDCHAGVHGYEPCPGEREEDEDTEPEGLAAVKRARVHGS